MDMQKKFPNGAYWGQTSIGNAKIGDIIHYYGRNTDATNGHWAMIIGCSKYLNLQKEKTSCMIKETGLRSFFFRDSLFHVN